MNDCPSFKRKLIKRRQRSRRRLLSERWGKLSKIVAIRLGDSHVVCLGVSVFKEATHNWWVSLRPSLLPLFVILFRTGFSGNVGTSFNNVAQVPPSRNTTCSARDGTIHLSRRFRSRVGAILVYTARDEGLPIC